jgi:hypothetical protein
MTRINRIVTWADVKQVNARDLNNEFNNIINTWNNTDAGTFSFTNLSVSGTLTVTGASTFTSINITNTTNQMVLGTTHTVTVSSTAPSASRTYTLPDAGAGANFVLDQGNYTIAGTWTMSNSLTMSGGFAATGTMTLSGVWDGWIGANETWTYASATTFTVAADVTGKYNKGDKIKLTQTTVKYFYILSTSFGAGTTTITVTGGSDYSLANAAITANFYSKLDTPQGFPSQFNWTPGYTGFSSNPTSAAATFSIDAGIVNVYYTVSGFGTSNATSFTITGLPVTSTGNDQSTGARMCAALDNGSVVIPAFASISGTTITFYKSTNNPSSWTNANGKGVYTFQYQYPY